MPASIISSRTPEERITRAGHGENHEGIHENADHGYLALLLGIFHVSNRMGMRGGTHSCLIGKEASRYTIAHSHADRIPAAEPAKALGQKAPMKMEATAEGSFPIFRISTIRAPMR